MLVNMLKCLFFYIKANELLFKYTFIINYQLGFSKENERITNALEIGVLERRVRISNYKKY